MLVLTASGDRTIGQPSPSSAFTHGCLPLCRAGTQAGSHVQWLPGLARPTFVPAVRLLSSRGAERLQGY